MTGVARAPAWLDEAADEGEPVGGEPVRWCACCSEEIRPFHVVAMAGDRSEATVQSRTGREVVDTRIVGPLTVGTLVLCHAGWAFRVLSRPS